MRAPAVSLSSAFKAAIALPAESLRGRCFCDRIGFRVKRPRQTVQVCPGIIPGREHTRRLHLGEPARARVSTAAHDTVKRGPANGSRSGVEAAALAPVGSAAMESVPVARNARILKIAERAPSHPSGTCTLSPKRDMRALDRMGVADELHGATADDGCRMACSKGFGIAAGPVRNRLCASSATLPASQVARTIWVPH
jgi:hypothetical protein